MNKKKKKKDVYPRDIGKVLLSELGRPFRFLVLLVVSPLTLLMEDECEALY